MKICDFNYRSVNEGGTIVLVHNIGGSLEAARFNVVELAKQVILGCDNCDKHME